MLYKDVDSEYGHNLSPEDALRKLYLHLFYHLKEFQIVALPYFCRLYIRFFLSHLS